MDYIGFVLSTALAIGLAGLLLLRWARTYPQALILMMPLCYDMVYVNASVFFLDTHRVFISETSTFSQESHAALRLLFFHALIVAGVWIGMSVWSSLLGRLGTTVSPPAAEHCRRVLWLLALILTVALANVLLSPDVPYPGSGFDRQSFWEHRIRFPFIRSLFGVLALFVPFVCAAVILYSRRLGRGAMMKAAWALLALYFLYLVIGGQVFHGLIFPASIVTALLIAEKIHNREKLRLFRWMPILIAGAAGMLTTVYLSFEQREISQSFANPWEAIVYRIVALSGSAYWQTDYLWRLHGPTGSLETLLHGREFLIQSIMPRGLATSYLRNGINLQGALPGTSLLSLGFWPTVLVSLGYGILLGFITSLVYAMVVHGQLLLIFPTAYLWLWTITTYGRASLEAIADPKFLLFAMIVALASLASLSARQSRNHQAAPRIPQHKRDLRT